MTVKIPLFGYSYLVIIGLSSLLYSCASSGSLTGGPVDKAPPKLDTLNSSKNYATGVNQNQFVFYFDEFVQVREVVKQVLVSPPLVYLPKVKSRGKQVIFSFNEKEVLKPKTTYIINFGEAIMDYNESNKLKNFRYVFSTGDQIDSLGLKGVVTDEQGTKLKDITVMLYDDLMDSVVLKTKPYYYTKTDEAGAFEFQNLKNDTFKIIALKDENGNLFYNELNEMIGYADEAIIWDSSVVVSKNLTVSKAFIPFRMLSGDVGKKGRLAIKMAAPPEYLPEINTNPTLNIVHKETSGDSIILWYDNPFPDSLSIYMEGDTLPVRLRGQQNLITKLNHTVENKSSTFISNDSLLISFSQPINQINDSFISIRDTHQMELSYRIFMEGKKIKITAPFKPKKLYAMTLLPGAIRDIFGNFNDTISVDLTIIDPEKLSKLMLNITSLDSMYQYIFQLSKGNKILQQKNIREVSQALVEFKDLKSDEYQLTIIEDANKNGRKDPADYWKKSRPEKAKSVKFEKIREGWVLEQEINYKELSAESKSAGGNEPSVRGNNDIERKQGNNKSRR